MSVPPFRLDLTVWALRRRPTNQIDCWDGATYRRVLEVNGDPVGVSVHAYGPADNADRLDNLRDHRLARSAQEEVKSQLERMLGSRRDLSSFYRLARQDPKIAPLVVEFRGLKPPPF